VRKLLRSAVRRRRAALPTIARIGPFRFFFYSNEGNEPPHVHVQQESMVAKFWLHPVALAASGGFSAAELRTVEDLVSEQRLRFSGGPPPRSRDRLLLPSPGGVRASGRRKIL